MWSCSQNSCYEAYGNGIHALYGTHGECSYEQIIVIICSHDFFVFAQVNLLMKELLHLPVFRQVIGEAMACAISLNASSSKWLIRAKNEMLRQYGKYMAILRVGETRWNSCQMMLASLLRVKTALKMFCLSWKDDSQFPTTLLCLDEARFWRGLRSTYLFAFKL